MKLVGYVDAAGATRVAAREGDELVPVAGLEEFWADARGAIERARTSPATERIRVVDVRLVPPVLPGARVLCIGLNYLKHVAEGSFRDEPLPEHPTIFARWAQSLAVDGDPIPVPSGERGIDWEGEIAAFVGEPLVDATPEEALAAVVGYAPFNDATSRIAQKITSQWILGKNGDNSGPLGAIVPADEVGDLRDGLRVTTRVNGEVVQDGTSDQMVYTVGDTLAHVSRTMTLRPGDVLATGTPSGVGYARTPEWLLQPGDEVEVTVEGVGSVRNPIVGNEQRIAAVRGARAHA